MVSSILKLFFPVESGESDLIDGLFSDCDPQIPNYHSLRPAKQKGVWGGEEAAPHHKAHCAGFCVFPGSSIGF